MDRMPWRERSLLRGTRDFACTACLLMFTLVAVLWGRSYFVGDVVHWHAGGGAIVFTAASHKGECTLIKFPAWSTDYKTVWGINTPNDPERSPPLNERRPYAPTLGFGFHWASVPAGRNNALFISVPHWFLALLVAIFVVALKRKPRATFSLFNLFVLITCVAVVLGTLAALDRGTKWYTHLAITSGPLPTINGKGPL